MKYNTPQTPEDFFPDNVEGLVKAMTLLQCVRCLDNDPHIPDTIDVLVHLELTDGVRLDDFLGWVKSAENFYYHKGLELPQGAHFPVDFLTKLGTYVLRAQIGKLEVENEYDDRHRPTVDEVAGILRDDWTPKDSKEKNK